MDLIFLKSKIFHYKIVDLFFVRVVLLNLPKPPWVWAWWVNLLVGLEGITSKILRILGSGLKIVHHKFYKLLYCHLWILTLVSLSMLLQSISSFKSIIGSILSSGQTCKEAMETMVELRILYNRSYRLQNSFQNSNFCTISIWSFYWNILIKHTMVCQF